MVAAVVAVRTLKSYKKATSFPPTIHFRGEGGGEFEEVVSAMVMRETQAKHPNHSFKTAYIFTSFMRRESSIEKKKRRGKARQNKQPPE